MDLQRGFVLHRRPYSETSLLVDLFTEETGRLTVIAKGARAKTFGMEICLYSLLRHYFFVGQEKAQLKTLSQVTVTFNDVTEKLTRVISERGRNYANIRWYWQERETSVDYKLA